VLLVDRMNAAVWAANWVWNDLGRLDKAAATPVSGPAVRGIRGRCRKRLDTPQPPCELPKL